MRYVAFVSKDSQSWAPGAYHIGLGVNTMHMTNVLSKQGVKCGAYSAWSADHLERVLVTLPHDSVIVVEALWLTTDDCKRLLTRFEQMHFIIRCHSQLAFIQADTSAIKLFREQLALQDLTLRFQMAGNSSRFADFIIQGLHDRCHHLPNLYHMERVERKFPKLHADRILRVGSFGATRVLKFHIVAAAASLIVGKQRGNDIEFYMSSNRDEGGGGYVKQGIKHLYANLPGVKLVEEPWRDWPSFRKLVSHMDICVQCSATESFNMVTADAIAEGVPCVVGPAIDWVPEDWIAEVDDPNHVAQKMIHVLGDPRAGERGLKALQEHNDKSIRSWLTHLASLN
jgi:hypothetical protein